MISFSSILLISILAGSTLASVSLQGNFLLQSAYAQTPNFSIVCDPNGLNLKESLSGIVTCTIVSSSGFAGDVTLDCENEPVTSSCSFDTNPVTVPAGGTTISKLTINAGPTPALHNGQAYQFQVVGTGGGITRSFNFFMSIERLFSISCSPGGVGIKESLSDTSTCLVTSSENEAITLSCDGQPADTTCSFNPNPLTVPGSGSYSVVTFDTDVTPIGFYKFRILGTAGAVVHKTNFALNVQQLFSISCTPTAFSSLQGSSGSSTCTVTSPGGLSSPVSLSCQDEPATASCSFSPNPVTPSGGAASSTLTFDTGTTDIGNYPFKVVGTKGPISHDTNVAIKIIPSYDFSLSCTPNSLSLEQTTSGTSTCTIQTSDTLGSPITFSCASKPAGSKCLFSPNPLTVSPGGSADSTLTFDSGAAALGTYNFKIVGTSGPVSHNQAFSVEIIPFPGFAIFCSPSSFSIAQGTSSLADCTITSPSDFSGKVNLSCSDQPSTSTCYLSPPSVDLIAGGSKKSTLFIGTGLTTLGSYNFNVVGTSGSIVRNDEISLEVNNSPDFAISCSPNSIIVPSIGYSACTITSLNSFSSPVFVHCTDLPRILSCYMSPPTVTPPAGGSVSSTLVLQKRTFNGGFSSSVNVVGTSGDLTRSAQLIPTLFSFFVVPESPIGILALLASSLAALAGYVFLRKKYTNKQLGSPDDLGI